MALVVEYTVFGIIMALVVGLGVYISLRGKASRRQTTAEVFLGSRSLRVLPLAASVAASLLSSTSFVTLTGHFYAYGFHQMWTFLMMIPAACVASHVFLPTMYELRLTSVFQYIRMRFHSSISLTACLIYAIVTPETNLFDNSDSRAVAPPSKKPAVPTPVLKAAAKNSQQSKKPQDSSSDPSCDNNASKPLPAKKRATARTTPKAHNGASSDKKAAAKRDESSSSDSSDEDEPQKTTSVTPRSAAIPPTTILKATPAKPQEDDSDSSPESEDNQPPKKVPKRDATSAKESLLQIVNQKTPVTSMICRATTQPASTSSRHERIDHSSHIQPFSSPYFNEAFLNLQPTPLAAPPDFAARHNDTGLSPTPLMAPVQATYDEEPCPEDPPVVADCIEDPEIAQEPLSPRHPRHHIRQPRWLDD
ncbi:hypothetical protein MTO96_030378 [Rhipicephalus appendiculatus]